MTTNLFYRSLIIVFCTGLFFLLICEPTASAKKKKDEHALTVIELQSMLMGYADRFNNTLIDAFNRFDEKNPSSNARFYVLNDTVYTQASVFTLAAEPNPEKALLDMVALTTLGRIIYQDNLPRRYGKPVEIMAVAYRQLDKDIWAIAAKVLTKAQQGELRSLILSWRKRNPNKLKFNLIRFNDFAPDRNRSRLVEKKKAGGLFKSVNKATEQIAEMRMVTERSMYLATRLPLLIGNFSQAWMNELILNPEAQKILDNVNTFSAVSERLASVAEQLPADFAKERKVAINQVMKEVDTLSQTTSDRVMAKVAFERETTINQFMDRLASERQNTLQELIAEEQRIKGLVTELRETLAEGSNLLVSATAFTEKLDLGKPADKAADAKPFDIQEYRDTIAEVSGTARELTTLVDKMDGLLTSEGWGQLLPQIVNTLAKVEGEGEKVINHTFRQAIFLILIWLVG
jgi:hypothetical protein